MYVCGVACVCGVAYMFVFEGIGIWNAIVANILPECLDSFPFQREFWHYAFFLVLFLGKVMPKFFLVLKYRFALPRRRPWSAR